MVASQSKTIQIIIVEARRPARLNFLPLFSVIFYLINL